MCLHTAHQLLRRQALPICSWVGYRNDVCSRVQLDELPCLCWLIVFPINIPSPLSERLGTSCDSVVVLVLRVCLLLQFFRRAFRFLVACIFLSEDSSIVFDCVRSCLVIASTGWLALSFDDMRRSQQELAIRWPTTALTTRRNRCGDVLCELWR